MARREYESPDVTAAARRMIRALVRRAEAGDTEALEGLRALETEVPSYVTEAMAGLHAFGYSWHEVGTVAGVTRQGARQRVDNAVAQVVESWRARVYVEEPEEAVEQVEQRDAERHDGPRHSGEGCGACDRRRDDQVCPHGRSLSSRLDRPCPRGFDACLTPAAGDLEAAGLAPADLDLEPDTLGPCGCVDYHMSDCPVRTGDSGSSAESIWHDVMRRDVDDDYLSDLP